jgi:hypothetical protein
MPGGAAKWAQKRAGTESKEPPKVKLAPSSSAPSMSSVSAASSESFEDGDKFHLPADHQPFVLLVGWDQPPLPPPAPDGGSSSSGSGSDSESDSSSESSESESESGESGSSGSDSSSAPPPPAPPPPGFACVDCAFYKMIGNGRHGCENTDFQRWAGTDLLSETKSGRPVLNPTRASSDWFRPATDPGSAPIPTRHNAK